MKIKETDKLARLIEIRDSKGNIISGIKKFNTLTKKAEIYAVVHTTKSSNKRSESQTYTAIYGESLFYSKRRVVTFKCHLIGYNAYFKGTNKIVG